MLKVPCFSVVTYCLIRCTLHHLSSAIHTVLCTNVPPDTLKTDTLKTTLGRWAHKTLNNSCSTAHYTDTDRAVAFRSHAGRKNTRVPIKTWKKKAALFLTKENLKFERYDPWNAKGKERCDFLPHLPIFSTIFFHSSQKLLEKKPAHNSKQFSVNIWLFATLLPHWNS